MRFAVLVKATPESEAGTLPTEKMLAEMGRFNDELVKAGILLAAEGLQASAKGARIRFGSQQPVVTDGPFSETTQLIAGFWVVQTKTKEEAVQWFMRAPFAEGEIELRQIFEAEDFGVEFTPELRAQEERQRSEISSKSS